MSDSKTPIPEIILQYARHKVQDGSWTHGDSLDQLQLQRERVLDEIRRYKETKKRILELQKYKKEIADWLASVDPS